MSRPVAWPVRALSVPGRLALASVGRLAIASVGTSLGCLAMACDTTAEAPELVFDQNEVQIELLLVGLLG